MTVRELIAQFPEIPADLRDEPVLAKLAETWGDLLRTARKPSACSTHHDAGNRYYLKLIGPMSIYGYGLTPRADLLAELQDLLARSQADPAGFAASLLTPDTAEKEVKGPGCR